MTNCGEFVRNLAASWQGGFLAAAKGVWVLWETYFMVLIF